MKKKIPMSELIAHVRKHASVNYETDGWDYLVECWEDADVEKNIGSATTLKAAVANCLETVKMMDEYRSEIQSTAF